MSDAATLLPLVEAASQPAAPRHKLGPQCGCTVPRITCQGIEWPEIFGVEVHGEVSDPGGDDVCVDPMACPFGAGLEDHYLHFVYAPELTDFFGTPIEVEYQPSLAPDCIWCLPETGDYVVDTPPAADDVTPCPDITVACGGHLVVGTHPYGYEDYSASGEWGADCPGSWCNGGWLHTETGTAEKLPLLMEGMSVEFTVNLDGTVRVDISFAVMGYQKFTTYGESSGCGFPDESSYACDVDGGIVLDGDFTRTFPAGSTWDDIVNEQIDGTITAIRETGTDCVVEGGGTGRLAIVGTIPCEPGVNPEQPLYDCIADFYVPRLKVENAYCILRDL